LPHKITLKDLTDHERKIVLGGAHQLLSRRDARGRGVFYSNLGQWDLTITVSMIRSVWYVMSAVEDDEEMQRKGVVVIGDWQGETKNSPFKILSFLKQLRPYSENWSFRAESIHSLYNNGVLESFCKAFVFGMPKRYRIRHRFHFGSRLEAVYNLRTFGIHMGDDLATGLGCEGTTGIGSPLEAVWEHLKQRSQAEDLWRDSEKPFRDPNSMVALAPNTQDIILGRSTIVTTWHGNLLYHTMVTQYAPRYIDPRNKDRIDKSLLAMEVIYALQKDFGSRFLSRKDDRWIVAKDAEVKKKVGQCLRIEAKGYCSKQKVGVHP